MSSILAYQQITTIKVVPVELIIVHSSANCQNHTDVLIQVRKLNNNYTRSEIINFSKISPKLSEAGTLLLKIVWHPFQRIANFGHLVASLLTQ